jgi:hypothetical protein
MHASLVDYILDLTQNSLEAGSTLVTLDLIENNETISLFVIDNGCGMTPETLALSVDPFSTDPKKHPLRATGFGLPFVKQAVEATEGSFCISSEVGIGTSIECVFNAQHPDSPPRGDLAGTIVALLNFQGEYELCFNRVYNEKSYKISRNEIVAELGTITDTASLLAIREYVRSLEEETLL